MAFLTFDNIRTSISLSKAQTINESIRYKSIQDTKVFLSYRRNDRKYVESIVRFLKSVNVTVYVDYLDETLEDQSNERVAEILRERINSCSKFICLATPDSGNSKWMPWELGLGDRIVNYKNVAILPLTRNPSTWADQEYAKIYGRIESEYTSYHLNGPENWNVIYPNGSRVKLKNWLNN